MQKIYLVTNSFSETSAASIRFLGLLKVFSSQGIKVDVVFFTTDHRTEAPKIENVTYHYYWKIFQFKNQKFNNLLYFILYRWLFLKKVRKGDIVYLYNCNELVSPLSKKRNIYVYHERTEHPHVSKMKFLNMHKYLRACSKINGLFVISTSLKSYFKSIGVAENKIQIINMTVDPSRFQMLQKHSSERYIAYCGKATNNKDGVDILIKSFAIISHRHPDVKLVIIGSPPNKSDESGNLELIRKLGISNQVTFTGRIPYSDVPQILQNAEVLALARPDSIQAKYGFPTKLGEYLLTGNPVVVTNTGDISLFLTDSENALISDSDNPEAFAKKLNWVLENKEKAIKIGEKGKLCALRYFNSDIEGNKIVSTLTSNLL